MIVNAILNDRRQTGRVTRWEPKTDQVDRWTASALLWIGQGFRKIRGHDDLPRLIAALSSHPRSAPPTPGSVAGSPLRGADPSDQTPSTTPGVGAWTPTL